MSNTKIEQLENDLVKVTIKIPLEKFEEGMEFAYNRNKNHVNIQGFRKGKAPRKIIEQTYGKEFLYEDAINFSLPEYYDNALRENNIIPVSRPALSTPVFLEDGVEVVATLFKKPEITIGKYKGVEIEKVKTEANEEDVLRALEAERENNARLINKNDEPVADKDVVKIDFAGYMDGKQFDGGTASDYSLVIGSKQFIDTFEEQLIGAKVGDEVEVNVTFPEGYQNSNLSGKPALFKVKIKEVNSKELPELDDEFAQSVSEFDTLEEYKADILKKLSEAIAQNAVFEKENKVVNKIIETENLQIPQVMIENRISQMVEEFRAQIGQQGIGLEDYLNFVGQTVQTLRAVYAQEAKNQVHARLILEAIAEAENFSISDEDFEAELERIASQYQMEVAQLKSVMREDDKQGIISDIVTRKALDLIVAEAIEL